ncbi:hypothetical protein ABZ820_38725, partial [Streptomyces diacarni]
LDREVPDGLDIHLVLDNYATHKTPAIKTWLLASCAPQLRAPPVGGVIGPGVVYGVKGSFPGDHRGPTTDRQRSQDG